MIDQASRLRGLVNPADAVAGLNGTELDTSSMSGSVPSGLVSYRPAMKSPNHDRPVQSGSPTPEPNGKPRIRLARAIAISSGKGGVGKTNLAVNLAVAMSGLGMKVCLLDADLGLANADVLCNLSPNLTLEHVVSGRCRLAQAMTLAPGGFRLIPGASGVTGMANLSASQRHVLLEQLAALEQVADVLLIDCGAGINANVVGFASAAEVVIVTTTPEPTAVMDAYGMIKALLRPRLATRIQLVVNMVSGAAEGEAVFQRIRRVCRTFLGHELKFGGSVPLDPAVPQAVRQRVPFVLLTPESPPTEAVKRLAGRLVGQANEESDSSEVGFGRCGFFARLAAFLGVVGVERVDR